MGTIGKSLIGFIKLQIPAGQANPAPPVGPALGQHGVNIMEFCKQFNSKTSAQSGTLIPVEIKVFADRQSHHLSAVVAENLVPLKLLKLAVHGPL